MDMLQDVQANAALYRLSTEQNNICESIIERGHHLGARPPLYFFLNFHRHFERSGCMYLVLKIFFLRLSKHEHLACLVQRTPLSLEATRKVGQLAESLVG